jgi:hypothetical protein
VDAHSKFAEEAQNRWDGGGRMPCRFLWKPAVNGKAGLQTVWLVKRALDDMQPMSKTLIARFIKEFTNYSLKVTNQLMLAMACNPLTATIVLSELEVLVKALKQKNDPICNPFLLDFRSKAKEVLIKQIRDTCSELIPKNNGEVADPPPVADEDDPLADFREAVQVENNANTNSSGDEADPVEAEVNRFFNQDPGHQLAQSTQKQGMQEGHFVSHWHHQEELAKEHTIDSQ